MLRLGHESESNPFAPTLTAVEFNNAEHTLVLLSRNEMQARVEMTSSDGTRRLWT